MPVPNSFQTCISDSLKKSLDETKKKNRNVGQTVASSAKRSLLEKAEIKFVKAEKDANSMLQGLKNKYICLNRSRDGLVNGSATQNGISSNKNMTESFESGIKRPKIILYPAENVKLVWQSPRRVGAGLTNLGNTCFLNSVLQCLSYTAPLSNHLLSGQHKSSCRSNGFCMLCELQNHISKTLSQHGGSLKPLGILQKLKLIAKQLRWGRQEDAHEFLRYVVDAIQKCCLAGQSNSLEKLSKETTFMYQVFGGYLRSQVRCLQCKTTSNTYDPVLDISVDLKGVNSLDKALQRFVQPETLDIDNAYKCARCKKKVRALKQFTVHKAPRVLTIHLKRFDYHRLMGGKVNRHIEFSHKLNLRTYMSQRQGDPVNYQLYAVLVHSGFSCNSGHYYCYVKAPNQTWYCMNDSHVSQTGLNTVLSAEAYILFYTLSQSNPATTSKPPSGGHRVSSGAPTPVQVLNGKPPSCIQRHSNGPTLLKASTVAACGKSAQQTPVKDLIGQPLRRVTLTTLTDLIGADSSHSRSVSGGDGAKSSPPTNSIPNHCTANHTTVQAGTIRPDSSTEPSTGNRMDVHTEATVNGHLISSKTKVNGADISVGAELPSPARSSHNAIQPLKLMSPPPSKTDLPSPHGTTTLNWQVTPVNGRSHHPSESESCASVNSTTSWQVTSPPKQTSDSEQSLSKDKLNTSSPKIIENNQTPGEKKRRKKKRKRKKTVDASSSVGASNVNGSAIPHHICDNPSEPPPKKFKATEGESGHYSTSAVTSGVKKAADVKADVRTSPKSSDANERSQFSNHTDRHYSSDQKSTSAFAQGAIKPTKSTASASCDSLDKKKKKKRSISEFEGSFSPADNRDATVVTNTNETASEGFNHNSDSVIKTKKKKKCPLNGDVVSQDGATPVAVTQHMDNDISNLHRDKKKKKKLKKLNSSMADAENIDKDAHDAERFVGKKTKMRRRYSEPVVKVWDAAVDNEDTAFQRTVIQPTATVWDGRRDSNISFLMERHTTVNGLGSGVLTWDGRKPEINREVEREKLTSNYKDGWYDGYEREIDEGRRKKVKVMKHKHRGNQSHFQSIQNSTNVVRQLKREGKLPSLANY